MPLTIWHLVRERPFTLAVALLLVLGGAGLSLVQPLIVGRTIEMVGRGEGVFLLVIILIAFAVVQIASETFGGYLQQTMGERGSRRARIAMGQAVLRSSLSPLSRQQSGDIVSRFTTDADAIRDGVARGYIQVVTATVTAIGAGTMLWLLDAVLFLIVAVVMSLAGAGAWVFLRRIEAASAARQQTLGVIGATVDRVLGGMRTIRVFHAIESERMRLNSSFDYGYKTGRRYATWTAAVTPAVELAATGSFLALLLGGGMRVASDQISLATLVSALLYSTILVVPIGALIEATISLSTAKGALARINEVIKLPDESTLHSHGADAQGPTNTSSESPEVLSTVGKSSGLHIRGLIAGYEGGPPVLAEVSLRVPPGGCLLIRGRSGSGKTTLVNVICRFLEPRAGRVVFDGRDLLRMSPDEARRQVAIAEQGAPMLAGTVREALAYGDIHATDAQMLAILEHLGLLADLHGPGNVLDREIGEYGKELSGGQRQRLSLARALLTNRPLLIADEPTTGLDELNRGRILSALQQRNADQTLIIISHDDADKAWADQILDLEPQVPAADYSARISDDR